MNKKKINQQEINKGLKLLVKSSIIVFVGLVISKTFTYLYRIIIARQFGPEIYGLFALSFMLVGWFRIFSNLGLKQGLLLFISLFRGKKEKKKILYLFRVSFSILVFTSITAGILLFFFSDFIALEIFSNHNLAIFLKIFSLVIPFAVLGELLLSVIRAHEKIGWFSFISNIVGNFVSLSFIIFFIFLGIGSVSVPLSYLIGSFSVFIASFFVCKVTLSKIFNLNKKKINEEKNKKAFKNMLSYSWPFIFQGFTLYIFYWVDSLMIGIFKTIEDVGFYNAAVPTALLLILPLDIFRQLFFPFVTKEYSKGNIEEVRQLTKQIGKWVFIMTAPFFILFLIFPGVFINLLFGEKYLVAENALRFLSVGALFSAIFGISEDLISIKRKSKIILLDMIFAVVINIVLNLIFVPLYGITGAGFATMLSMIVLNIIFVIQSNKYFSVVPVKKKMLRISLVLILSTVILLVIKSFIGKNLLSLLLSGFFFILVYIFLIISTNCLDKNDWYILKTIFKKLKFR